MLTSNGPSLIEARTMHRDSRQHPETRREDQDASAGYDHRRAAADQMALPLRDYCAGLLTAEGRKSVEPMATAPAQFSMQGTPT